MATAQERLGQTVRARRLKLGLSETAAATAAGVARGTWSALERGTQRLAEFRYAGVERALSWAPGSVEALMHGGRPEELPPSPRPQTPKQQLRPTPLSELDAEIERIQHLPLPVETRLRLLRALVDMHIEQSEDRSETRRTG